MNEIFKNHAQIVQMATVTEPAFEGNNEEKMDIYMTTDHGNYQTG